MRIFFLAIILITSSALCSAKNSVDTISVDNIISDCIKIKKNKIENFGNILILDTTWEIRNNIGICGCKSAALKYDVKLDNGNYISSGVFSTIGRKNYKFVISSDNEMYKKYSYKLLINCN